MNKKFAVVAIFMMVCMAFGAFALNFTSYSPCAGTGSVINIGGGYGFGLGAQASYEVFMPVANLPFSFGGVFAGAFYGNALVTYIDIGAMGRAAYHIDIGMPNVDVYFRVDLGLDMYMTFGAYDPVINPRFAWGAGVGARYYFNDKMSAFVEGGGGFNYGTAGISMKM